MCVYIPPVEENVKAKVAISVLREMKRKREAKARKLSGGFIELHNGINEKMEKIARENNQINGK